MESAPDQMGPQKSPDRFDELAETRWTAILENDWHQVWDLYSPAVRRYLRFLLEHHYRVENAKDLTDDLFHDFAVKLFEGRFAQKSSDRRKGKFVFRKYMMTAIRNQVLDELRRKKGKLTQDPSEDDCSSDNALGDEWLNQWRDRMLEIAWDRFEQRQQSDWKAPYYHCLRVAAEYMATFDRKPTTIELVRLLNERVRPVKLLTKSQVNKIWQRSSEHFAETLVQVAMSSLRTSDRTEAIDELRQLRLEYLLVPGEEHHGDDQH